MSERVTRDYVESLPLKEVSVGGVRKSVRYDQKAGKMYGLDDRGRWNGTVKDVPQSAATVEPQPQTQPKEEPVNLQPPKAQEPAKTDSAVTEPLANREDPLSKAAQQTQAVQQPQTVQQSKSAQPENTAPVAPGDVFSEEEIVDQMPDENGEQKKKPSILKGILFALLALGLVAAIVVTALGGRIGSQEQNNTVGLESTQPTTLPPETVATPTAPTSEPVAETTAPAETEPKNMISVLAPNQALIPGQILNAELFDIQEITETDYRVLSASVGIYTADKMDRLQGLVTVKYVPAGKYLSYEDVGRSFGSVNPWEGEYAGYKYIVLPVSPTPENLTYFNWASTVSLSISVQIKQTNDNSTQEGEETTPDGMEHESSVLESMVLDTYRLSDVRIADLQNVTGESLFSRYYSIASIPSAFQMDYLSNAYKDTDRLLMDIPSHIVLCVTDAQYELLAGLPQDTMTVEISKPVFVSGSALQNETYAMLRDAETVIAEAWKQAESEAANAESGTAQ